MSSYKNDDQAPEGLADYIVPRILLEPEADPSEVLERYKSDLEAIELGSIPVRYILGLDQDPEDFLSGSTACSVEDEECEACQ